MAIRRTLAEFSDDIATADIADDAVTTAKIADSVTLVTPNIGTPSAGVVTNLSGVLPAGVTGGSGLTHLASNPTVTLGSNATFPTSHIIQVVTDTNTDEATTSGSVVSVMDLDIPNCASTSRLWVNFSCGRAVTNADSTGGLVFIERTGSTIYKVGDHVGYDLGWAGLMVSATIIIPASEVSAGTNNIKVTINRVTGSATFYMNQGTSEAWLTIMEIV